MTTQRQKLVDRYLRAANIGTLALLIYPVLNLSADIALEGIATGLVWLLAAFVMLGMFVYAFSYILARHRTDEFTLALWHAGTTAAFFAVIAWLLFGDLVQSLVEAYIVAHDPKRADPEIDVIGDWALIVTLTAFFIGFHRKRLSGDIA